MRRPVGIPYALCLLSRPLDGAVFGLLTRAYVLLPPDRLITVAPYHRPASQGGLRRQLVIGGEAVLTRYVSLSPPLTSGAGPGKRLRQQRAASQNEITSRHTLRFMPTLAAPRRGRKGPLTRAYALLPPDRLTVAPYHRPASQRGVRGRLVATHESGYTANNNVRTGHRRSGWSAVVNLWVMARSSDGGPVRPRSPRSSPVSQ